MQARGWTDALQLTPRNHDPMTNKLPRRTCVKNGQRGPLIWAARAMHGCSDARARARRPDLTAGAAAVTECTFTTQRGHAPSSKTTHSPKPNRLKRAVTSEQAQVNNHARRAFPAVARTPAAASLVASLNLSTPTGGSNAVTHPRHRHMRWVRHRLKRRNGAELRSK